MIAVRLTTSVPQALKLENVSTYYWSDSSTVLAWIKKEYDWVTFVNNRVREIQAKHRELNHAGVEITMSALRESFWILAGRKVIRSAIRKCVNCRRHDSKPLESVPAPLPLDRIRDAAVFEIVGVDFAGPVYLKGGQKAWICVFTCAIYRAMHLELVTSLSTPSFLMALRRHISRRGRPRIIYSDNGTNFEEVARVAATKQIEWKFNPPTAAWWGGFWERLIGILKRLLRRTLRKSCLTYEEMLTTLLDCEAIINNRPITFMSERDKRSRGFRP
ncbi:uncharacterized protein LOC143263817 [Megalopta genalis]|uniref:uncharacterized protein LOC143263817 n=1 Tax=Megalopta genalis TaxID=115081 RepID=UPI003FCF48D8